MDFKSRLRLAVIAAALMGVAALTASNAQAASTTFTANADIVAAIGISKTADMDFGGIVSGTAGTVVLTAADPTVRTCNTVTCANSAAKKAAKFTVTGEGSLTYAITLPASANIVTGDGVGTTKQMAVGTFTSDKASNAGTLSSGSDTFNIGATLTVDGDDLAGAYTGTFTVTVEYN